MARTAKPKKEVSMEEALWKSADKLRGSVEPVEYKHVVLSLFFLKFASDKFEAQRKMIAEKYGDKFVDNVAFYPDFVCIILSYKKDRQMKKEILLAFRVAGVLFGLSVSLAAQE